MNSEYKRFSQVGPGGMRCLCCGPAPGKAKKQFLRLAKRAERARMLRELQKEIE